MALLELTLKSIDSTDTVPYRKNKIKTKIQTTFHSTKRKSKRFAPRNLPFKTEESKRRKVESNISDTAPLQSESSAIDLSVPTKSCFVKNSIISEVVILQVSTKYQLHLCRATYKS